MLRENHDELAHVFSKGVVPLFMMDNCFDDKVDIKCYYKGFRDLPVAAIVPYYDIVIERTGEEIINVNFIEREKQP